LVILRVLWFESFASVRRIEFGVWVRSVAVAGLLPAWVAVSSGVDAERISGLGIRSDEFIFVDAIRADMLATQSPLAGIVVSILVVIAHQTAPFRCFSQAATAAALDR
jgi:hypothetical protein